MTTMLLKFLFILPYGLLFFYLHYKKKEVVFYFPFFINSIFILFSLVLIENGQFIVEQQKTGFGNLSFMAYWLYSIANLTLIFAFFSFFTIKLRPLSSRFYLFWVLSFIEVSILLYFRFSGDGEAGSQFRFDRFSTSKYERFLKLYEVIYFASYVYYILRAREFGRSCSIFVTYFFIGLLKGSLFSGFISSFSWFYISYIYWGGKLNYRIITALILVVLSGVFYKFLSLGNIDSLVDRFALQGHLFWGVMNNSDSANYSGSLWAFIGDFFSIASYQVNELYGLGSLMVSLGGEHATNLINLGIRYTSGYPAILIHHFSFNGFLILFPIFTFVYVSFINASLWVMNRYSIIGFILFSKVLFQYFDFYIAGEYGYFKFKYVLFLLIFVLYALTIDLIRRETFRQSKVVV